MPSIESLERQLAQLDELRHADCHNAIARVASIMGHLVGTPLNVIAGRAALIRANAADAPAVLDDVARIERQVEQLTARLRALIEFLAVPDAPPEVTTAGQLLADVLALYEPIARARGVALELSDQSAGDAPLERATLFGLLTRLVSLVVLSTKPPARVTLGASRSEKGGSGHRPNGFVRFSLSAPGLNARPPHKLDRIDLADSVPGSTPHRYQVMSVSSAIADRAGGRLDVLLSNPDAPEILLYWPCGA